MSTNYDITLLALRLADRPRETEFPADLKALASVRDYVRKAGEEGGLKGPAVKEVELAIDEAVTNLVTYSLNDPDQTFNLVTWSTSDHVFFQIEDHGPPFNYETIPEPDLKADLGDRAIGGLGWFLIRQTMDVTQQDRRDGKNFLQLGRLKNRSTIGERFSGADQAGNDPGK